MAGTLYPAQIDNNQSLPLVVNNFTPVTASTVNLLQGAILAIEAALGILPQASYGTVAARLTAIENAEGGGGGLILGGDLGGTNTNQVVIGIQGRPVSPVAPSLNQLLGWNGTDWAPTNPSSFPSGPAGGNLGGSYPNPAVIAINGATIPVAGGLTTGNVLQVNGTSSLVYAPVNLAGGTNYIVGTLPVGNIPNLAGDTTGTIVANTNVKIQGRAIANIAPLDGYALTWVAANNDWEPQPKIAIGVPNLAGLRSVIGKLNNTAIMAGYYTVGDGGGGDFYWDNSSSTGDDGATIIVPTGSTTGRWARIFDGTTVNVSWFGAKGDGVTDDTAAIQAALNWNSSIATTIKLSGKPYLLTAPINNVALYVGHTIYLQGTSGSTDQFGTNFIINGSVDGYMAGSGILFEGPVGAATGSQIRDIYFTSVTHLPRNALIIHTDFITIENCNFNASCSGNAIMIESGYIGRANYVLSLGTGIQYGCYGYSRLAPASYVDSDFCRVSNCLIQGSPNFEVYDTTCNTFTQPLAFGPSGAVTVTMADTTVLLNTPTIILVEDPGVNRPIIGLYAVTTIISPTQATLSLMKASTNYPQGSTVPSCFVQGGAAVSSLGSDSNDHLFDAIDILTSQVGFKDGGEGPSQYNACYTQYCRIGYLSFVIEGASIFINGGTEDYDLPIAIGGGSIGIGGAYASKFSTGIESIGNGQANIGFNRIGSDGFAYGANIPNILGGGLNAPLSIFRDVNTYFFSYNFLPSIPYTTNSFIWKPELNGALFDVNNGIMGWTDSTNTRGTALHFVGSAAINTPRHWKWKQNTTLQPGANIVYLNGGATDAGSFSFCDDGYSFWSLAQSAVTITIEYNDLVDLVISECFVSGYTFISEGGTSRNVVANIYNTTGNIVNVNLVWGFDMFVTNYNVGSGNIG